MTEKELCRKLGQKIKKIREQKGISQIELAAELNYEKSNMSRLEAGNVNPRLYTLYRVAEALEVPLKELMDLHSDPVK